MDFLMFKYHTVNININKNLFPADISSATVITIEKDNEEEQKDGVQSRFS